MNNILDFDLLLRATPAETAKYLRRTHQKHDEQVVNAALLQAVEEEIISPTIFRPWLALSQQPESAICLLKQDFSAHGRSRAIRTIGTWMNKGIENWTRVWTLLGEVAGMVDLLAQLSVREVKFFLKNIGWSYRVGAIAKQDAITELFQTLCSVTVLKSEFPQTRLQNPDQRPLLPFYLELLPACTDACVRKVVDRPDVVQGKHLRHRLLLSHTKLMQDLFHHGYASKTPALERLCVDAPSGKSDQPGFTATMLFSWSILKNHLSLIDDKTAVAMVVSLLSRAVRNKIALEELHEIVQIAIDIFSTRPDQVNILTTYVNVPLDETIKCWSLTKQSTESRRTWDLLLTRIMEVTRRETSPAVIDEAKQLKLVERARRFELLRLIALHKYRIDVTKDHDLKRAIFRQDIYFVLDHEHAINLLQRSIKLGPDGRFMEKTYKELQYSHMMVGVEMYDSLEPLITLAALQQDRKKLLSICQEQVRIQQTKAEKCRDQAERANCAKAAIVWAVRSGSLQRFQEVVLWLRRFIRDPLTIRALATGVALAWYSADLLAVVPRIVKYLLEPMKLASLRADIVQANGVLQSVLEMIDMARKEPSYNVNDWGNIRTLFKRTVATRMRHAEQLEREERLTTDQAYDIVWIPTLELCKEVVKHPAWTCADASSPEWNLNLVPPCPAPHKARRSQASLRFLDNIAKIMDNAWVKYRILEKPTTAIIPSPFPKGLPIQCLLSGANMNTGWCSDVTPFIASRAKRIAFMEPKEALSATPSNPDIQEAIGSYVDSFRFAVAICVYQESSVEEQQKSLEQVLGHWMPILCQQAGMPVRDAIDYLKKAIRFSNTDLWGNDHTSKLIFSSKPESKLMLFKKPPSTYNDYPKLPRDFVPHEVLEWNPTENVAGHDTKKTDYKATIVDILVEAPDRPIPFHPGFSQTKIRKVEQYIPQIWDMTRFRCQPESGIGNMSGEIAEGLIIAAMLCLDAKLSNGSRLLDKPYPNAITTRYPAMYLDSQFLENPQNQGLVWVLETLLIRVPSKLLAKLTEKHLKVLTLMSPAAEKYAYVQETTFGLLKILAESDTPGLGCEMIVRTILDTPDSSSWHRQLLTSRFLKRLPATLAEQVLRSFSQSIVDRWQPAKPGPKEQPADHGNLQAPRVKITTVKLLAQLINCANYVSVPFSVNILSNLLKDGSHIDVQAAALDALKDLVLIGDPERENQNVQQVLQVLESIVPIISRFNEREEVTNRDWDIALVTEVPPSPYDRDIQVNPPLMERLAQDMIVPEKYEEVYFKRIVEPALIASLVNRRKWHRIVVKKFGGKESLADPVVPFTPDIFGTILERFQVYMKMSDVKSYFTLRAAISQPSTELASMNNRIKEKIEWNNSPEGQYWLSEFDQSVNLDWQQFSPPAILAAKWKDTKRDDGQGIYREDLRRLFMHEVTMTINAETASDSPRFENLIRPLTAHHLVHDIDNTTTHPNWPREETNGDKAKRWLAESRPILEEIQDAIEQKRTAQWQQDKNRIPQILPAPWHLARELLPYPFLNSSTKDSEERCRIFAESIYKLLSTKIQPIICSPTFIPLDKFKFTINKCNQIDVERTISYLASIESPWKYNNVTPAGLYCILLAEELIRDWNRANKHGPRWDRVRAVVQVWTESDIEAVRVVGVRVLGRMSSNEWTVRLPDYRPEVDEWWDSL